MNLSEIHIATVSVSRYYCSLRVDFGQVTIYQKIVILTLIEGFRVTVALNMCDSSVPCEFAALWNMMFIHQVPQSGFRRSVGSCSLNDCCTGMEFNTFSGEYLKPP